MSVTSFDPNAAATPDSGIFGLPHSPQEARLVLIPVPWDVTTSYRAGTAQAPKWILEASRQVDLFDLETGRPYAAGIALLPLHSSEIKKIISLNRTTRRQAEKVIRAGGVPPRSKAARAQFERDLKAVNQASERLNQWVQKTTAQWLDQDKIVGILGGDHSVPFGALNAVAQTKTGKGGFGVLHFDAHSDTRKAYEGFEHSHASIFYNVLTAIPQIHRLVQVGVRDLCQEEMDFIQSQKDRVHFWSDLKLQEKKRGQNWEKVIQEIIAPLPSQVWVSFDIDGLDPKLCPSTGTPVPGGLEFFEATSILRAVVASGRKIIGFDLNEVGPAEWDANVGARLLYKLCGWALVGQ